MAQHAPKKQQAKKPVDREDKRSSSIEVSYQIAGV
jgi:hypothetical protein